MSIAVRAIWASMLHQVAVITGAKCQSLSQQGSVFGVGISTKDEQSLLK